MAFKSFYFSLWLFLILFAAVKGSCLEYGHSCWGAHGKRSGNSKIYHTVIKAPTEIEFQDPNGIHEKHAYDSTEEQINSSADLSSTHDMIKESDELMETPHKNSIKYKKFLYKKLNKISGKQRNLELPVHDMKKSNLMPMNSERWRRLPLYNLRSIQLNRPGNDWIRELEQEQQINEDDYI